jgi:hypothetical protein
MTGVEPPAEAREPVADAVAGVSVADEPSAPAPADSEPVDGEIAARAAAEPEEAADMVADAPADVDESEPAADAAAAAAPEPPEQAEQAEPEIAASQPEPEDSDAAADSAVARLMVALGAAPADARVDAPTAGTPAPAATTATATDAEAEAALAAALSEPLPEPVEPPRARVIKIRRIERPVAPSAEPADEAAPATQTAPQTEAQPEPELARLSAQERAAPRPHLPEAADDGDVQRLIDEANSQLMGPENRRRLSAIAHLKAAVAATAADRRASTTPAEADESREGAYRDDLEKVVRPRRPVSAGTSPGRPAVPVARPAPLVLVSEQRIDRPAAAEASADMPVGAVMPVRPRRPAAALAMSTAPGPAEQETAGQDAASPETGNATAGDDGNFFAPSRSFAEFAEALGADALTDLLEAAIAYAALVEGRPHVSRPQMLRHVGTVRPDAEAEREALLRSFGSLVRQGRIERVKAGQFALPDSSEVLAEARRIAS